MDGDVGNLARLVHQRDVFLGADKRRLLAEEMHRDHRHADRKRTHAIGDRHDGS